MVGSLALESATFAEFATIISTVLLDVPTVNTPVSAGQFSKSMLLPSTRPRAVIVYAVLSTVNVSLSAISLTVTVSLVPLFVTVTITSPFVALISLPVAVASSPPVVLSSVPLVLTTPVVLTVSDIAVSASESILTEPLVSVELVVVAVILRALAAAAV